MRIRSPGSGRPSTLNGEPRRSSSFLDASEMFARAHLHHRAQLFREQRGEHVAAGRQRDVEPASRRERHLGERREQAAVGEVVIREQQTVAVQRLDRREEGGEPLRIVDVGATSPSWPYTCASAEPPRRAAPAARSIAREHGVVDVDARAAA